MNNYATGWYGSTATTEDQVTKLEALAALATMLNDGSEDNE